LLLVGTTGDKKGSSTRLIVRTQAVARRDMLPKTELVEQAVLRHPVARPSLRDLHDNLTQRNHERLLQRGVFQRNPDERTLTQHKSNSDCSGPSRGPSTQTKISTSLCSAPCGRSRANQPICTRLPVRSARSMASTTRWMVTASSKSGAILDPALKPSAICL